MVIETVFLSWMVRKSEELQMWMVPLMKLPRMEISSITLSANVIHRLVYTRSCIVMTQVKIKSHLYMMNGRTVLQTFL